MTETDQKDTPNPHGESLTKSPIYPGAELPTSEIDLFRRARVTERAICRIREMAQSGGIEGARACVRRLSNEELAGIARYMIENGHVTAEEAVKLEGLINAVERGESNRKTARDMREILRNARQRLSEIIERHVVDLLAPDFSELIGSDTEQEGGTKIPIRLASEGTPDILKPFVEEFDDGGAEREDTSSKSSVAEIAKILFESAKETKRKNEEKELKAQILEEDKEKRLAQEIREAKADFPDVTVPEGLGITYVPRQQLAAAQDDVCRRRALARVSKS